jgi:CheY-like chemotaxis protein
MRTDQQKTQVLYVGNDAMLSKATAELLKRTGYRVRVTSPLHAVHTIREGSFAAVILCATLSSEEAEQIVQTVALSQHPSPVVSVHLGLLGDGPNPGSSIVVDALSGPEALISAVDMVTRTPGQSRSISKAV